ncbi:MAG: PorV/PorQ family protein [Bacteroidetes bacterium]|nr:PorV/PorQ family protein [Bacteroidota bacterium]
MYKLKFIKYSLLIIFYFAVQNNLSAQNVSKTGTTAANFLEIGVGANAVGMGGAFVSIANDATALYWNVGGIAMLPKFEAVIVHTDWLAETNFDFAGLVLPLGDFGTLGFSFTSLSMDDMVVRTVEKPDGTGELFSAGDIAVGLSYGRHLTERFSIGFTVKYIEQTIWHMNATGIAIDAGTVFKTDLFGGMTIGATISNFGTSMKLEGRDSRYFIRVDDTKLGSNERIPTNLELDTWDLPLLFQIGVSTYAVNSVNYKLLLAADATVPNNNYQSMNLGAELSFMDFLFLRSGYNSLMLDESEGGLTLGVGVNSNMILSTTVVRFDYAYRDFGRLQNVHNFTVGIKF